MRSATKCLKRASEALHGQARGAIVQRLFQGGRQRLWACTPGGPAMTSLAAPGSRAAGFSDSIRKLGPSGHFFRAAFGPKLEPGHLIMTKSGYQYMYFYFPAKMGPNIFIFTFIIINILGPRYEAKKNL